MIIFPNNYRKNYHRKVLHANAYVAFTNTIVAKGLNEGIFTKRIKKLGDSLFAGT